MEKTLFKGTFKLLKLILRRERIKLTAWTVGIIGLTLAVAFAYPELFPSTEQQAVMAQLMENPAMVAMFGKPFGIDTPSPASLFAIEMNVFMLATMGIMSILMMTRYTRGDEEDGTLELIKSFPVGRIANIVAATLYVILANLLIGSLLGFGLGLFAHSSFTWAGSFVFGFSLAFSGIVFAGFAALFAQLTENTRTALTFSFSTLGFFYILRAFGDVSAPWLSFFSPLGLLHKTETFVNNYLWPLFLSLLIALLLFAFAYHLNNRRDVGSGLFKAKEGEREASSFLKSPLGLSLRLLRTSIITWIIVIFILGISYGSIFGDLTAFFDSNEQLQDLIPSTLGGSLEEQFLSTVMSVMVVAATLGALMVMVRLSGEEKKERTLQLYANTLSRARLFLTYVFLGFIASLVFMVFGVLGMYVASASVMNEPFSFYTVFISGFAFYPAIFAFLGIGALIMGLSPTKTWIVWLYLTFAFILLYFGNMLDFKEWMLNMSPYEYMPRMPIEDAKPFTSALIVLLGIIVGFVGFSVYQKRDLQG
ncbi:MAG: ABC transporter permease [Bacillota bacterium]